jgi:hypothetical protein
MLGESPKVWMAMTAPGISSLDSYSFFSFLFTGNL